MNRFTLSFLPYFCMIIVLSAVTIAELRDLLDKTSESGVAGSSVNSSDGMTGWPKNGWSYLSMGSSTVICPIGFHRYKVYHVSGARPNMQLSRDRYGLFFRITAEDDSTAEMKVDLCYR